jgi:ADP-ribose pyrophosphatase
MWHLDLNDYSPVEYTSKFIEGKPWAEPNIGSPDFHPKWNMVDYNSKYVI